MVGEMIMLSVGPFDQVIAIQVNNMNFQIMILGKFQAVKQYFKIPRFLVFENKCFENISNFLFFRIIPNDQLSSGLESHLPIYQAKHGKQFQHL